MKKDNPNINDILDKVESCKNIKKFYNQTINTGLYDNGYNPEKPTTKEVKQVKEEVHTEEIMENKTYENKMNMASGMLFLGGMLGGALFGNEGFVVGAVLCGLLAFIFAK